MAKQTYIVSISNTEDIAVLGLLEMDDETDSYSTEFAHGLRSLFNDPQFVQTATEFADQTWQLAVEIPVGLTFDDAEDTETPELIY